MNCSMEDRGPTEHATGSAKTQRREASAPDPSRRDFVRWLTAGLCWSFAQEHEAFGEAAGNAPVRLAQAASASESSTTMRTESDVGSLWPFIQGQAVSGEFPLS